MKLEVFKDEEGVTIVHAPKHGDDFVSRLLEADDYNRKYYVRDPLHAEAANEITRLRKLIESMGGEW